MGGGRNALSQPAARQFLFRDVHSLRHVKAYVLYRNRRLRHIELVDFRGMRQWFAQ